MLVYSTGKRFPVRDRNLSYQHCLDFRKVIQYIRQLFKIKHIHISAPSGTAQIDQVVPLNWLWNQTYQPTNNKKILDFSIADCGHIYASTACKSASLALEDTSRTGEVATAKMLANTNDKQAPKPEKGEYKSTHTKKKSERKRDLSVRFCYQQIPN